MFLYGHWLKLPISTRHAIADKFGIVKKGSTEVFNDTIKSDGYLIQDIEGALSLDAMQHYLDTEETNAAVLWTMLVDKIEGIVNPVKVTAEQIINGRGVGKKVSRYNK